MNLTTISVSGLALSVFAAAIALRADGETRRGPPRAGTGSLPPPRSWSPGAAARPGGAPRARSNAGKRTYERAVQKDARAKQGVDEALPDMRHVRRRKAPLSIDGVRRALGAQTGGSPSRVSLDSSK